jgi:hypothetical protein
MNGGPKALFFFDIGIVTKYDESIIVHDA